MCVLPTRAVEALEDLALDVAAIRQRLERTSAQASGVRPLHVDQGATAALDGTAASVRERSGAGAGGGRVGVGTDLAEPVATACRTRLRGSGSAP